MKPKKIDELSNNELIIYKKELSDEFEATKGKIDRLCEELQKIEKEYNKVDNELKIRGKNLY